MDMESELDLRLGLKFAWRVLDAAAPPTDVFDLGAADAGEKLATLVAKCTTASKKTRGEALQAVAGLLQRSGGKRARVLAALDEAAALAPLGCDALIVRVKCLEPESPAHVAALEALAALPARPGEAERRAPHAAALAKILEKRAAEAAAAAAEAAARARARARAAAAARDPASAAPACTACGAPAPVVFCHSCDAPYCSPACQRAAWGAHRAACRAAEAALRAAAAAFAASRARAEAGSAEAMRVVAGGYEAGAGVAADARAAAAWLARAAEAGDAFAQVKLGLCFKRGRGGVAADARAAAAWFARAAEAGHAVAQLHLGRCYARGEGVARDVGAARNWIARAAAAGDEDAPGALAELDA